MKHAFLTICFLFVCCVDASSFPYIGKHSALSRSGSYILIHEHSVLYDIKNGMLSSDSFSYMELIDLDKDEPVLFKVDSYLLSDVFVIDDGNYSVGLSNISQNGNPQLVLLSRHGQELMKVFIDCSSLKLTVPCRIYQSGYIEWYDTANEPIKYKIKGDGIDLIISGYVFSYRKSEAEPRP